jgi:hypothetical protein
VSLYVRQHGPLGAEAVADVCASFQATAVKMLVRKAIRAARESGIRRILLTGGVAANGALRDALEAECAERGYRWTAPPPPAVHGQRGHDRGGGQRAARGRRAGRPHAERARDPCPSRDAMSIGGDPLSEVDRLLASLPDGRHRGAARP